MSKNRRRCDCQLFLQAPKENASKEELLEIWKEKAKETVKMFLPIAGKLGIEKLSAELNDLALKYM